MPTAAAPTMPSTALADPVRGSVGRDRVATAPSTRGGIGVGGLVGGVVTGAVVGVVVGGLTGGAYR